MKCVITYGTFDVLHFGHIRLLERAKALGDYLIVGVTSDDWDKARGKINVKQSLMERIEAVRSVGIADEIIVEEYEGQKIDDIKRYQVDIFTVGSDWIGEFDYLKEYCEVVYLERTEGISSSDLRTKERHIRLGLVGDDLLLKKVYAECKFVNGIEITYVYSCDADTLQYYEQQQIPVTRDYSELFDAVDAVYIASEPRTHYKHIKLALEHNKHVLCHSPFSLNVTECQELISMANQKKLVLMDSIKTAYSTAYNRLLLLLKGGKIGNVVSVDVTCTSLQDITDINEQNQKWNSICGWGPIAMLPVFQILGTEPEKITLSTWSLDHLDKYDLFTKIDFLFRSAVATIKVGKGIKSEGNMIVSGTDGYIYVPAPWWKTDYFEVRYENPENNQRYFYQLDGEGIRYAIVAFLRSIETGKSHTHIDQSVSEMIVKVIEKFETGNDVQEIKVVKASEHN